ncbi:MAG: hypothetical protein ACI4RG_00420 [Huintestinicola sp.]
MNSSCTLGSVVSTGRRKYVIELSDEGKAAQTAAVNISRSLPRISVEKAAIFPIYAMLIIKTDDPDGVMKAVRFFRNESRRLSGGRIFKGEPNVHIIRNESELAALSDTDSILEHFYISGKMRPVMYNEVFALYGIELSARELDLSVPAALKDYYEELGKYGFNRAYNTLLSESELIHMGEYTAFYTENQDSVRWCYKNSHFGDDPPVFQTADGESFYREADKISEFLISMACFQGLMGGLPYSDEYELDFYEAQAEKLRSKASRKPCCVYPFMGMELFETSPRNVIGLTRLSNGSYSVMYAACTEEDFNMAGETVEGCVDNGIYRLIHE